jgi:rod shape-determining protein MreC
VAAGGSHVGETFLGRRWWVPMLVAVLLGGSAGASARLGLLARPAAWLQAALLPAERVLARTVRLATTLAQDLRGLRALEAENARLRAEVATLQTQVLRDAALAAENQNLRQLLQLQQTASARYGQAGVVAEVIGRDPTTWFDTALLDKGSADGVVAGMIALTPAGLVGRVVPPITAHSATLMLVTDPEFGVGVLDARTGAAGAAVGTLGSQDLTMTFFAPDPGVRVGDPVVTSGLDGQLPRGLPVGTVVGVDSGGPGLVQQAQVRPLADVAGVAAVLLLPPGGTGG